MQINRLETLNRIQYHALMHSNCDFGGKVIAEYIWIGGNCEVRSKCRTLEKKVESVEELPVWNYDGSSTYQADTRNSEIMIYPRAIFKDPFRGGDNILVMCDAYKWKDDEKFELVPTNTNFRYFSNKIFSMAKDEKPWFGLEQEYTQLEAMGKFSTHPLGWPG